VIASTRHYLSKVQSQQNYSLTSTYHVFTMSHQFQAASAPVTHPDKLAISRVPRVLRDPRVVFKDIQNIPPASEVLCYNIRPPARSMPNHPKTQSKPPLANLVFTPSPSPTASSSPLTACLAPAGSGLIIARRGDSSTPGAFIHGHVRSRHEMVPPPVHAILPAIPPFKPSSIEAPTSTPAPCSRNFPLFSSVVHPEPFDLLKESILNEYYRPSASSDSLTTLQLASDNWRPPESQNMYPFSRRDKIASFAFQSSPIKLPVGAGPALLPASACPSKKPCHYAALMSAEVGRIPSSKLPTFLVGTCQDKRHTNTLMKDEADGFSVDMLNILSSLETLALKVKTLDLESNVPKSKSDGSVSSYAIQKQGTGERSVKSIPNSLTVYTVPSPLSKLEKGKGRITGPVVQCLPNQPIAPPLVSWLYLLFSAPYFDQNNWRILTGFTRVYGKIR
jgi:hypothetical protein